MSTRDGDGKREGTLPLLLLLLLLLICVFGFNSFAVAPRESPGGGVVECAAGASSGTRLLFASRTVLLRCALGHDMVILTVS